MLKERKIIIKKKVLNNRQSIIEKIGNKIPDPVFIFIGLYIIVFVMAGIFGGAQFQAIGKDGANITYEITNMFATENMRWVFENAILNNWLGYAGGILGTILIIMFGIGIADESGLLSSSIRKLGGKVSDRFLPYVLVFLGIISNIASDAGYLVLIPLAGLLYVGIGKHPVIGMAAAFAGVSAGFSANLIPATIVDVIIGTNAEAFAEAQGVPFVSYTGETLNSATMHYFFMIASTFLLVFIGGFITNKFIRPRFENDEYVVPQENNTDDFKVTSKENKAFKWAGVGFIISIVIMLLLAFGPLANYVDEAGKPQTPFLDNIILMITIMFAVTGLFYGFASGKFKGLKDIVDALSKQIGSMGYVIVLTFFCYNFLSLLTYTNVGTYITYLGSEALKLIGAADYPILLILGFIIITALVNLFVGGLTSKWMLLGPVFIPMLYHANNSMTPDVVAAAYRIADSSTNIITPLMTYAGVILLYMRKYKPKFTVGNLIGTMIPYSIAFIISWTILLIIFFVFKIPLGF